MTLGLLILMAVLIAVDAFLARTLPWPALVVQGLCYGVLLVLYAAPQRASWKVVYVVVLACFTACDLVSDRPWQTELPLALVYFTVPTLLAIATRHVPRRWLGVVDAALIIALWIPIERHLVPMWPLPASSLAHSSALLLCADVLALSLYLQVRRLELGWSLQLTRTDIRYGLQAFIVYVLVVGLPLSLSTGFAQVHVWWPGGVEAVTYPLTRFFLIAMIEEFFFRGVIQNLLEKACGPRLSLAIASVIFGFAHYGIGPDKTDVRYFFLAALAGVAYGWVYQKTRHLAAGAVTHALVDITWGLLFGGPRI